MVDVAEITKLRGDLRLASAWVKATHCDQCFGTSGYFRVVRFASVRVVWKRRVGLHEGFWDVKSCCAKRCLPKNIRRESKNILLRGGKGCCGVSLQDALSDAMVDALKKSR